MRNTIIISVVLALLILAGLVYLVIAAPKINLPRISPTPTPTTTPTIAATPTATATPTPTSTEDQFKVSIANFTFNPATLTVPVGAEVNFKNNDKVDHTITSTTGQFDSGTLQSGDVFTYTYNNAGTYDYFCKIHPNERGSVVVK